MDGSRVTLQITPTPQRISQSSVRGKSVVADDRPTDLFVCSIGLPLKHH